MAVMCPQGILDKFDFLIDGRAKKQIEVFIKKKPKFEEICKELEVKNCMDTSKNCQILLAQTFVMFVSISVIPDICYFCYTGKIFGTKILHRKVRKLRKIGFCDKIV